MRALLAGLFVYVGLLCVVLVFAKSGIFVSAARPWMLGIGAVLVLFLLMGIALVLFNKPHTNALGLKSPQTYLLDLEKQGLLADSAFRARRAFEVEETEDEGLHYFLELDDGRVLYLNGQYLYDYAPITDDPELNQARQFPCTEFTVRRHKTTGYVVDVQCEGTVLEPETLTPRFTREDWKKHRVPEDGEILNVEYDSLKALRASASA